MDVSALHRISLFRWNAVSQHVYDIGKEKLVNRRTASSLSDGNSLEVRVGRCSILFLTSVIAVQVHHSIICSPVTMPTPTANVAGIKFLPRLMMLDEKLVQLCPQ